MLASVLKAEKNYIIFQYSFYLFIFIQVSKLHMILTLIMYLNTLRFYKLVDQRAGTFPQKSDDFFLHFLEFSFF